MFKGDRNLYSQKCLYTLASGAAQHERAEYLTRGRSTTENTKMILTWQYIQTVTANQVQYVRMKKEEESNSKVKRKSK